MADQTKEERGITAIAISGFKSLRDESRIEIRNLTVLAGANSSGKSSIMQPLLLLKQTLEAPYDPGALKLDGPNVVFTSADQFLTRPSPIGKPLPFVLEIGIDGQRSISNTYFKRSLSPKIELIKTIRRSPDFELELHPNMSSDEIARVLPPEYHDWKLAPSDTFEGFIKEFHWHVILENCFLDVELYGERDNYHSQWSLFDTKWRVATEINLTHLIYVPGNRGNPERAYPTVNEAAISDGDFAGTFGYYTAGIIRYWQERSSERLEALEAYLILLRLTSKITASYLDETRLELLVGRTKNSGENDLVSLADVGFGVSQVLPVLVALLVAEPGQLVYIEQPELHLHPRAQVKLAEIIADAANRGVRVVIETHSELLLLGIQTAVAEGKLATDKVILHWFKRDDEGVTKITSGELDENGAYGDWPQDFDTVEFDADGEYLDAIAKRRVRN